MEFLGSNDAADTLQNQMPEGQETFLKHELENIRHCAQVQGAATETQSLCKNDNFYQPSYENFEQNSAEINAVNII